MTRLWHWWQGTTRSLAGCFVLAWVIGVAPRAAAALALWPDVAPDYFYWQAPQIALSSYWYPFYRLLAAVFWRLSLGSTGFYIAIHVLLHALIAPLVYFLFRGFGFDRLTGWLSVLGVAFLPYYVSLATMQPQAGLVVTIFAAMLWAMVCWIKRGLPWGMGLLAAFLAFAAIAIRSNSLIPIACLYVLACWKAVKDRYAAARCASLAASGIFLTALMLALMGVMKLETGHFSPFPPLSGLNLYLGNNQWVPYYAGRHVVSGYLEELLHERGLPPEAQAIADPYERDKALAALGRAYIRQHPLQTVQNMTLKSWRYWDFLLDDASRTSLAKNLLYTLPYLLYVTLALASVVMMFRRRDDHVALGIILMVLLSFFLSHLPYQGVVRNRMTTEFLLLMLAARIVAWPFAGRTDSPRAEAETAA